MSGIYLSAACVGYGDFPRLARLCRELDAGAELSLRTDLPGFGEKLERALPLFADIPLTLHGPYMGTDAAARPGTPQWEHLMQAAETAFGFYRKCGAASLTFHTHGAMHAPRGDHPLLRRYALENMTRLAQDAERQGISLTFENVGIRTDGDLIFEEREFIALFDALPESAGCLLDVGHALINSWDVFHLAHRLGGRIRTYHLHNNDGLSDQHRPLFAANCRYSPGEMEALLPLLRACAPQAAAVLEYKPSPLLTEAVIREDVQRIRRYI